MTTLIYLIPNSIKNKTHTKEVKTLFHHGKEIRYINYSETTANKNFCEVGFVDGSVYFVASEKIEL